MTHATGQPVLLFSFGTLQDLAVQLRARVERAS